MDVLGIDIGTVSVKYLRWSGKKGRAAIVSKGDFPYHGELEDLQKILTEIRDKEGSDVEVSIGITSQEVIKKTFTIPLLPKEELKEAISWSATKFLSVSPEDMVYEYEMLGEIDERGVKKNEVFFVGIEKAYVNRLISALKDSGFRRIVLLTDTVFAYVPFVEPVTGKSSVVIDIGGRQTGIHVFYDKKLRFVREILTASESFSDALLSGFRFNYDEAEKYKIEKGFNDESQNILSVPLERLVGEVQRTLDVYVQKYPDQPIDKIYITGRGSNIPNLLKILKEYFPEQIGYLPTREVGDEFFLSYALCTEKGRLVNLLPREVREKEKEESYKKWIRIGTAGVAGVLVFFSLNLWNSLNKTKISINTEKTYLSQRREQLAALSGSMSPTKQNEILPWLGEAQKRDITLISLLKYLSSSLPKDIYLKELEYTKERQTDMPQRGLKGEAISKEVGVDKSLLPGATKKENPQTQTKAGSIGNFVGIRGYVLGDPEMLEPSLLSFVIGLGKTGVIHDVVVVEKYMRELKGVKAMEFLLQARCPAYEL